MVTALTFWIMLNFIEGEEEMKSCEEQEVLSKRWHMIKGRKVGLRRTLVM